MGQQMAFGGYLRTDTANALRNGNKRGEYRLEFYNATSNLLAAATASPAINSDSVKDAWILSSGTATVPSGTTRIRFIAQCVVPTAGDGVFTADDVYLRTWSGGANQFTSTA
ncbi:hypothetical protein RZS08_56685, partial [Arthrospira platensis SPKY1]|nr:hypothetical protein [Arthrospira platensis SPKY1]